MPEVGRELVMHFPEGPVRVVDLLVEPRRGLFGVNFLHISCAPARAARKLIRIESAPSWELAPVPEFSLILLTIAHASDARNGLPLSSGDALRREPRVEIGHSVTHGPADPHERRTRSAATEPCGTEEGGRHTDVRGGLALSEHARRPDRKGKSWSRDWTGAYFFADLIAPDQQQSSEIWFRAHDNGITFGFSIEEWTTVHRLFGRAWSMSEVTRAWDALALEYGEL